jgi:predicted N-acetyltransferase YhbS
MHFVKPESVQLPEITDLFVRTFTASEGAEEGGVVGALVQKLMTTTSSEDLIPWVAVENQSLIGGLFFSRLCFANPVDIFLMAPVAVDPAFQGQGVGQSMIRTGLDLLKTRGVAGVVTYGDPAFYSKTGFTSIIEAAVPAPFPLQMPQGWLGQSFIADTLPECAGPVTCVEAFNDPALW